jgi:hypothetical protein
VEIIIDSRSLIMEHNHIVPGHFAERKVARSFSFDDVFRLLLKNGFRPKKHGDLSVVFFCGENVITLKTTRDPITLHFLHCIRLPDGFIEIPLLYLLNQWNRDHRYITAFLDGENDIGLSMDCYFIDGMSEWQFLSLTDVMTCGMNHFHNVLLEFENSLSEHLSAHAHS